MGKGDQDNLPEMEQLVELRGPCAIGAGSGASGVLYSVQTDDNIIFIREPRCIMDFADPDISERLPGIKDRIQVEVHILEINFRTERGDAMDVFVRSICHIQTDTATDTLEHDAVFANLVGVLSLETAQFDFDGIADLQNNSPFLSWT